MIATLSSGNLRTAKRPSHPAGVSAGGLVVVAIPRSGVDFVVRYLSHVTGWNVAPSNAGSISLRRSTVDETDDCWNGFEMPQSRLATRATIQHCVPVDDVKQMYRNPRDVALISPAEVVSAARATGREVLFLYRGLRDVVNSLAHKLCREDDVCRRRGLAATLDDCVRVYAPVLASIIREWRRDFSGVKLRYECLVLETRSELARICRRLDLPVCTWEFVESMGCFRTPQFRRGGVGDWRRYLAGHHSRWLEQQFPDLV